MKKTFIVVLVNFLLVYSFLPAQTSQKAITNLKQQTNAQLTVNQQTGTPEFITFTNDTKSLQLTGNSTKEKAINFLNNHKDIYAIKSIEKSLKHIDTKKDTYGSEHVIFQQQYNGVPIFDGALRFHFDSDQNLKAINGLYIAEIALNTTAKINIQQANTIALNAVHEQQINTSGVPLSIHKNELFVFQKGIAQGYKGQIHLAYKVEVWNKTDVREFIFVDAHKGHIIEQFTGMHNALDRILYEESTSNIIWQEGDPLPGSLDQWQQNEIITSEHSYNFFKNAFGFVSYDGKDAQMKTINNNNNPDFKCPNASWNGVTANYCSGTASDDVVAHEWGHAYTEYTCNLIYQWQSGAINEALSDIWGETIDLINEYEDDGENNSPRTGCGSSDRWKMGEDASAFNGAIRDMWDPTCDGDPGKVTDSEYKCSRADFGGVHSNSGVVNKTYVLIVEGGTFNGQTINGIGFTKAAHVFWQAQSSYLTATSDFIVLADALEASATDLLGIDLEGLSTATTPAGPSGEIISQSDINEISKAIEATQLRVPPTQCNFLPILAPIEPICEAATISPIFTEDWESGIGNWTIEELPSNTATWTARNWEIKGDLPADITGNAIFATDPIIGDCESDLENGVIRLQSPVITMRDDTDGVFEMSFDHYIETEKDWDGGNIKYSLNGDTWKIVPASAFTANPYNLTLKEESEENDNPLAGQEAFSGTDGGSNLSTWGTSIVDLSALNVIANSTIQFRWEMGTDGCNGLTGWYVDNITIYNCSQILSVIEYEKLTNDLVIYPNPSNGTFVLQKRNNTDLSEVKISDITGKTLKIIDVSDMQLQKEIHIEELPIGAYFITVITKNNKAGVFQLLKQ